MHTKNLKGTYKREDRRGRLAGFYFFFWLVRIFGFRGQGLIDQF